MGGGGGCGKGANGAAAIDSEEYFLACCRYIELNPVRAGMVDHPRSYRWTSYRAHVDVAADALPSEHTIYHALRRDRASHPKAYRQLFHLPLDGELLAQL